GQHAQPAPHRPGTAPALGLRAGIVALFILSQTGTNIPLEDCSMLFKHLQSWLNQDSTRSQRQSRKRKAKPTRQRSRPLLLETLEDRTVPTVLFAPQFGIESAAPDGAQRINSPNLYVVLWGSSWGSLVSRPAQQ